MDYVQQLEVLLANVRRCGEFCCGGVFPSHLPGVIATGFGMLGLPLAVDKVEALTKVCGEGASVDEKAASGTWQLVPSQFQICNTEWHSAVELLVYSDIMSELGLSTESIMVELNGLFLYGEGKCCLPQLDAEKDNRTFARLVLLLPSLYSGGELVVTHDDKKKTFDFSSKSACKNHYIAFYADCSTQIQSIGSGNLLVLIYNLNHTYSFCLPIEPAVTNEIVPSVTKILQEWQTWNQIGQKALNQKPLVIVLNLKCTKTELSWEKLKGRDGAVSSVMKSAVEELPIDVYLCLVYYTRHFSAKADECHDEEMETCDSLEDRKNEDTRRATSFESKASSSNGFNDDNELDSHWQVSHFIRANGTRSNGSDISVGMSDIVPSNAFRKQSPYKEVVMTQVHNGVIGMKHYRSAALLLLPRKDFSKTVTEGSLSEVVDLALKAAEDLSKNKSDKRSHECNTAITVLIYRVEKLIEQRGFSTTAVPDPQDCIKVLKALQLIQNYSLSYWFLRSVIIPQAHCSSMEMMLIDLANSEVHFGFETIFAALQLLVNHGQISTIISMLKELRVAKIDVIDVPNDFADFLASKLLQRLLAVKDENIEESRLARSLEDCYRDAIVAVTDLFCIYSTFGKEAWLKQAISYVRRTPLRHPVEIILASAIENWHRWLMDRTHDSVSNAVKYNFAIELQTQLIEDCVRQLKLVRQPQEPILPYKNPAYICKCEDCKTVDNFRNDPKQTVLSVMLTTSSVDHLRGNDKLSTFEVSSKLMRRKDFIGDILEMLLLTKGNDYHKRCETYNRCQAAIGSLIALLPTNNSLKHQPE